MYSYNNYHTSIVCIYNNQNCTISYLISYQYYLMNLLMYHIIIIRINPHIKE